MNEFKAKGWKAPGYHYVVFPDGKIEQLLAEDKVSNGVQGYNSTSINIAYVGGIDGKGRACDNRTNDQQCVLRDLLADLKRRYPNAHIMGHRDIWGKSPSKWKKMCPCFDAEAEYANIGADILEKYNIAEAEAKPVQTAVPASLVATVKKENIWDKIKKLAPWSKKS